jgi:hypothetical protein
VATPQQIEALLSQCREFSRFNLHDHGEFSSFAAVVTSDGEVGLRMFSKDIPGSDAGEYYLALCKAVRREVAQGGLLAVGVTANVNIPSELDAALPDGVRIHLETPEGGEFIYVPYSLRRRGLFRRRFAVTFREEVTTEAPLAFFVNEDAPG